MTAFLPQPCECSLWLHLFSAPVPLGFAQTSQARGTPALQVSARNRKVHQRWGKRYVRNTDGNSQQWLADEANGQQSTHPRQQNDEQGTPPLKSTAFQMEVYLGEYFSTLKKRRYCSMNPLICTLIFTYLRQTHWFVLMSGLKEHLKWEVKSHQHRDSPEAVGPKEGLLCLQELRVCRRITECMLELPALMDIHVDCTGLKGKQQKHVISQIGNHYLQIFESFCGC